MEIVFLNAKDNAELTAIKAEPNTAIIGLNITNSGTLTKEGFPQHRFYSDLRVVTLGVQRLHKPEERASLVSIAGQAFSFVTHNPSWAPGILYRPIYDITPDDSLAAALLDPEMREDVLNCGTVLSALLGELVEWTANRYAFVKQDRPRLLNNFLIKFPYPFKDIPGQPRADSCKHYLIDQMAYWSSLETMHFDIPIVRTFPQALKSDVISHNERSALILVETDRYGSDDLIAQQYFQANPKTIRAIMVRKVYNSSKHFVSIYNSNLYDENLKMYPYPNVKELNGKERKVDGDSSWKNLKVQTIGPKKGTVLSFEDIWNSVKIDDPQPVVPA
jgi:hypothetical protein